MTTARRLAAIMCADVVGYSALMAADEAGTLRVMTGYRRDLWQPTIERHSGRIIGTAGDSFMVEFSSIVAAVDCATAIQVGMQDGAADDGTAMQLRIGVHLGDVIEQDDDLYGDGINLAARLQEACNPGGVAISDEVFRMVDGKVTGRFSNGGEQNLKNLPRPVRVWHWRGTEGGNGGMQAPANVLPALEELDRPSIAVLPFANFSSDPEQEFFAVGMSDDLITNLSKISGLVVIARNSSFVYKGKNVSVPQVSRELGVRYILEGSVRKAGNRVRINAQLIDGVSNDHLWADIFNGVLDDIFQLQDEVIDKIMTDLKVVLTPEEAASVKRVPTENLEAYQLFLKAEQSRTAPQWDTCADTYALYDQALAIDPNYQDALEGSLKCTQVAWQLSWRVGMTPKQSHDRLLATIDRLLALDADNGPALMAKARYALINLRHDEAVEMAQRTVQRQPSDAPLQATYADILLASDQMPQALEEMEQAIALAPRPDPDLLRRFGMFFEMANQPDRAITYILMARAQSGNLADAITAAATYAKLDDLDKARQEIERLRESWPWMSRSFRELAWRHIKTPGLLQANLDALARAGMPYWPFDFSWDEKLRLSTAELEQMFLSRPAVTVGRVKSEPDFDMLSEYDGAGGVQTKSILRNESTRSESSRIQIRDDAIFCRDEYLLHGREIQSLHYRNPNGSSEDNNEYLAVSYDGIRYYAHRFVDADEGKPS